MIWIKTKNIGRIIFLVTTTCIGLGRLAGTQIGRRFLGLYHSMVY